MLARTMPMRVCITDDHSIVRTGISSLLTALGFHVVMEAEGGRQLLQALTTAQNLPDIILLDISMKDMDGWEALSAIRQRWPEQKVVFFSGFYYCDTIVRAFSKGISGFIAKNACGPTLKTVLEEVRHRGISIPPEYCRQLLDKNNPRLLTDLEHEYLGLLCRDPSNKEIASRMCKSERTIDGYRDALKHKLEIQTIAGLAAYAIDTGLATR